MSLKPIKVHMENVGGNESVDVVIKPNQLSILYGGNATGKTSVVKGLATLVPSDFATNKEFVQREGSNYTLVTFTENGLDLTWTGSKPLIYYPESDNAFDAAFIMESNLLVNAIKEGNVNRIRGWFQRISSSRFYDNMINGINQLVHECKNTIDSLEENRKMIPNQQELVGQKSELRRHLKIVNEEIDNLENTSERIKTQSNLLRQNSSDIADREKAIQGLSDGGRYSLGAGSDKQIFQVQGLANLKRRQAQLATDEKQYTHAISVRRGEHTELVTERDRLAESATDTHTNLEQFQKDENLPSKAEEHFDQQIMENREELELIQTLLTQRSDQCEMCGQSIKPLVPRLRAKQKVLLSNIRTLEATQKKYEDLNQVLTRESTAYDRCRENLDRTTNAIRGVEESLVLVKNEHEQITQKIREHESQIRIFGAEIEDIRQDVNFQKSEIKKLQSSDHHEAFEILITRKDNTTKRINQNEALYQRLHYTFSHLGHYNKALRKLTILRTKIQDKYIAVVEYYTNELNRLLGETTNRLKWIGLDIRFESGSIRVYRNGTETPLHNLSGAEKQTISLILLYVCKRAFVKFPILIIDDAMLAYDKDRFDWFVEFLSEEIRTNSDFNYCLITNNRTTADQALAMEYK